METTEEKSQTTEKKSNKNARWYIVKCSSGKEARTAELLRQRVKANDLENIISEIIVPTQEKIVIKKGKKSTVEERMLPGYILIEMEPIDEALHLVRNTDGISGFIGSATGVKKPTPLQEKEVKAILELAKVKQNPTYQTKLNVGDAIKVADPNHAFNEFVGSVQEINDSKGQVTVLLSIFGRETPVHLDFLQVTKI